MFPSFRRPLLRALIASVLIHAALLLSAVSVFPLRLESPATSLSVAIHASPRRDPAPVSAPAARPLPVPEQRPAPKVKEALVAERPSEAPATSRASPASSETTSAISSPPAPAVRGGGATAATGVNPGPARAGVSADDLRQYSMSLGIAARRFKRYPPLARERGWEGRAEVALIFSAPLPLPEVVLVRSSGRAVLDEQAVEMMTQASRVTTLPDSLKGHEFRLPQAVQFSLADDQ